jgi:hypothetical protein
MTIENRELYYELKECYPEFFDEKYKYVRPARACGKTLMITFLMMAIEYTGWFVHKLEVSTQSLTRKEYEIGLETIEQLLYGGSFPTAYKYGRK